MSTLHINLHTRHVAELEAGGFLGGLQNGWNALVTFASGLLVALGTVLPRPARAAPCQWAARRTRHGAALAGRGRRAGRHRPPRAAAAPAQPAHAAEPRTNSRLSRQRALRRLAARRRR